MAFVDVEERLQGLEGPKRKYNERRTLLDRRRRVVTEIAEKQQEVANIDAQMLKLEQEIATAVQAIEDRVAGRPREVGGGN